VAEPGPVNNILFCQNTGGPNVLKLDDLCIEGRGVEIETEAYMLWNCSLPDLM